MNVIPVIIYAAELAVAAIILFYVVEMLTMPANMKRVCQGLIILIAILSVTGVLLGSAPSKPRRTASAELTEQPQHHPVKGTIKSNPLWRFWQTPRRSS